MATLNWTLNPNWAALPFTVSYWIEQTVPGKFTLTRHRSDGQKDVVGEGYTSLEEAQAYAQADLDQNFKF